MELTWEREGGFNQIWWECIYIEIRENEVIRRVKSKIKKKIETNILHYHNGYEVHKM